MQMEQVREIVTEMLAADPTLSYPDAMERLQVIRETGSWNPVRQLRESSIRHGSNVLGFRKPLAAS